MGVTRRLQHVLVVTSAQRSTHNLPTPRSLGARGPPPPSTGPERCCSSLCVQNAGASPLWPHNYRPNPGRGAPGITREWGQTLSSQTQHPVAISVCRGAVERFLAHTTHDLFTLGELKQHPTGRCPCDCHLPDNGNVRTNTGEFPHPTNGDL